MRELVRLVVAALVVGCGSALAPAPGPPAQPAPATGGGSCGTRLFVTPEWSPRCQPAADAACCDLERACAADQACVGFFECSLACPRPRTDACNAQCLDHWHARNPATTHAIEATVDCVFRNAIAGGKVGRPQPLPNQPTIAECGWMYSHH